jgi:hypothetical protein
MWSERAKDTMKRCALAADMSNVVIVLEPEAASLCVQTQQGAQVRADDSVLVVDCGGGTVDLVTHLVHKDGTVKELTAGRGECFGGSHVDANFAEMLQNKYSTTFVEWAMRKPKDVLRLRRNWLATKANFGSPGWLHRVLLNLPPSLQTALEAAGFMDEESDGELELSEREMKSIFDPVVDRIIALTTTQFAATAHAPTKLLLVGGFAASPYLQQRVREAFESRVEIVVPPTPGAAVVKGAVIYGLKPHAIQGRVLRRTFGVEVARSYKENRHNPKHRYHCPDLDKTFALQVFLPLVRAEAMVESGFVARTKIKATSATSQSMTLLFYSCLQRNPVHLDEPGVRPEGVVTVAMPGEGLDRFITVEMKFGRTQIQASGINENGDRVETALQFVQPNDRGRSRPMADRDPTRLSTSRRNHGDVAMSGHVDMSDTNSQFGRDSSRLSNSRRAEQEDHFIDFGASNGNGSDSPRKPGPPPPPKPDSNFPTLSAGPAAEPVPNPKAVPPPPPPKPLKLPTSPPPGPKPPTAPPPARKPKPTAPAPPARTRTPATSGPESSIPAPPPPPGAGAPVAPPPPPALIVTSAPALGEDAAALVRRRKPRQNEPAAGGSNGDLLAQIRQGRKLRQSTWEPLDDPAPEGDGGLMDVLKLKMLMRRSVMVDEDEDSDGWDC